MNHNKDWRLVDIVLGYFAEKEIPPICPSCGSDEFSVYQRKKRYGDRKSEEVCITSVVCDRCEHMRSFMDIYPCESLTLLH